MYKNRNSVLQIHSIGDVTVLVKTFNTDIRLETCLKADLLEDIDDGFLKPMSSVEIKDFIEDKIDLYEEIISKNFKNYNSIIETLKMSKHQ